MITEIQRCENDVFVLPVNILTGVARRLLGPHDTLPCVLIFSYNYIQPQKTISLLLKLDANTTSTVVLSCLIDHIFQGIECGIQLVSLHQVEMFVIVYV